MNVFPAVGLNSPEIIKSKFKAQWLLFLPSISTLLTNKKTSNDNDPTNINGKSFTSIANAFNTYFVSVAENLLTKNSFTTDITKNDDPMRYL